MSNSFEGVIILGMPRSGTTLLRRLLNAHRSLVCPAETGLLAAASRLLTQNTVAGGLSLGVISGLGFAGFTEDEVLERLRKFVFSFWRDLAVRENKPIWVEKTAIDLFHLETVETLCGERCRYVNIVRNPLDVICSLSDLTNKMQGFLPEIYAYVQRHRSWVSAYAEAWVDGNAKLLDFERRHPNWCIRLKYEDLVQQPALELQRICEFLGLPEDVDLVISRAMEDRESVGLGDWKTYEQRSIEASRKGSRAKLGGWTVQELADLLNPTMEQLGYKPIKKLDVLKGRKPGLAQTIATMNMGVQHDR
jgi:protein-tyrosine sulfotransferase